MGVGVQTRLSLSSLRVVSWTSEAPACPAASHDDLKLFWVPRAPASSVGRVPRAHLWPRGRDEASSHVGMAGRAQGLTVHGSPSETALLGEGRSINPKLQETLFLSHPFPQRTCPLPPCLVLAPTHPQLQVVHRDSRRCLASYLVRSLHPGEGRSATPALGCPPRLGVPTGSPPGVRSRPAAWNPHAPRPAHSPVMSTARVATGRRGGRARQDNAIQPAAASTASAASGGSRRWHSQSSAANSASAANSGRPRRRSARRSCSSARAPTSSQAPPDGQGQRSMAAGGAGAVAELGGGGSRVGTRGVGARGAGCGGKPTTDGSDTRFLGAPSGRAYKEPGGAGRGRGGGRGGAAPSLLAPRAGQVPPPPPRPRRQNCFRRSRNKVPKLPPEEERRLAAGRVRGAGPGR